MPPTPTAGGLLTVQQVAKRYGINTRSVWRWEQRGWLPRAVRLGRGIVRWRESDIVRHLESLVPGQPP
jgi:prophage regulatory protein